MKKATICLSISFLLIMAFLALMILGLGLSPLLKVKLLPDRTLPSVTVYYSYSGANAVVVDSEVTSRLEDRRLKTEDRSWKTEVGRPKTEVRRRKQKDFAQTLSGLPTLTGFMFVVNFEVAARWVD